jgi:UDP-perosamine 4-acetyltransferase
MNERHRKWVLLGGGQHAAVILDAVRAAGQTPPVAILDADPDRWDTEILGVPVVGSDACLPQLVRDGVSAFSVGVGSTKDTSVRRCLYARGLQFGLFPISVRHPAAICSSTCSVGLGTQILAGAIVNTHAQVGDNAILNTGAIVEHDCKVGQHVHVATGARIAGAVTIGDGAHIGAGATIRQGISIGPQAVVGAGAVVVHDVGPGLVVAGVPARELRKVAA